MLKKAKFRPRITKVRLYPEQAVLSCTCYNGLVVSPGGGYNRGFIGSGTPGWCTPGGGKATVLFEFNGGLPAPAGMDPYAASS